MERITLQQVEQAAGEEIGDDGDSLTEMSEACLTHDDTIYKRNGSYFCK